MNSIEIKPETKQKKKEQECAIRNNFFVDKPSLSLALNIPTSTGRTTSFICIIIE